MRHPFLRKGEIRKHGKEVVTHWQFIYFFKDFFLMWTIFKVFIDFVTILLLFCILVLWLQGMWNLICLIRDRIMSPTLESKVLTTGLPGKFPPIGNLARSNFLPLTYFFSFLRIIHNNPWLVVLGHSQQNGSYKIQMDSGREWQYFFALLSWV